MRFKPSRKIESVWKWSASGAIAVMALASPARAEEIVRPEELVVRFPATMSDSQVKAALGDAGCKILNPIAYAPGTYRVGTTRWTDNAPSAAPTGTVKAAVTQLRQIPGVLADPNYIRKTEQTIFTPNDPELGKQNWHYNMIHMPEAWAIQAGSRPAVCGVIDSGADPNHPDLKNMLDSRSGNTISGQFSPALADTNGHGTHVSGTIAAQTNNSVGVAGVAGHNGGNVNVKILAIQAGAGGFSDAALVSALGYMALNGVDVVNMSLGGYGDSTNFRNAVLNCIASGVSVVASTGNDATNTTTNPHYPSDYPGVIAVSAVGPSRTLASYSNFGGNVSITAPGGDSTAARPQDGVYSTYPVAQGSYSYSDGTSMSSPHVAGVCTLLAAAGVPRNPATMKQLIQSTADVLDETPNPSGGNKYGAGLVNPYRALLAVVDPDPSATIPDAVSVAATGANVSGVGGTTYFHKSRFQVTLRGVKKMQPLASAGKVSVVLDRVGGGAQSITYIGGTAAQAATVDFVVPSPTSGQIDYPVMIPNDPARVRSLSEGLWQVRVVIDGVVQDTNSIEVRRYQVPAGRSMFAMPFKVDTLTNPETTLLSGASFSLLRYDVLHLSTSGDYARYNSSGTQADAVARLGSRGPDNTPISFEITDATTSVAPLGLGYWLDMTSTGGATKVDTRQLPAPGVDDLSGASNAVATTSVGVRLFAANGGWNMIGNPFLFPVSWSAVAVIADGQSYTVDQAIERRIIGPALVGYTVDAYRYYDTNSGVLNPFSGYWVRAYRDCTLVIPPSVEGRSTRAVAQPQSTGGWRMRVGVSVAGETDGENYFGQMPGASNGEDLKDYPKPPSAGSAYARFLQKGSDDKTRSYAYDLRAVGGATARQEWTLAVTSGRNASPVTVHWESLGSLPRQSRLSLKDLTTGKVVPMGIQSSYTFQGGEAGVTRQFAIVLEPQQSGGALAFANVRVAAQTRAQSAGLTVRFTTTQEAEVVGVVKTVGGQTVARLSGSSRAVAGGEASLRWDGRNLQGASVPMGPYVVEVRAKGTDGQTAVFQRTVQNVR